jgi:hypothetical protein
MSRPDVEDLLRLGPPVSDGYQPPGLQDRVAMTSASPWTRNRVGAGWFLAAALVTAVVVVAMPLLRGTPSPGPAASLAVAGPDDGTPSPGTSTGQSSPPHPAGETLDCAGIRFPASALPSAPASVDVGPAQQALSAFLADVTPDNRFLPRAGWTSVSTGSTSALYLAETKGTSGSRWYVQADGAAGNWRVTGWGECPLLVAGVSAGPASWVVKTPPRPADTVVHALVTELACSGGQSPDGRVDEPSIQYGPSTIIVTFTVRPLPGVVTCEMNKPGNYNISLPGEVGHRHLLDGGATPPKQVFP